jgi:hypothetical protein
LLSCAGFSAQTSTRPAAVERVLAELVRNGDGPRGFFCVAPHQ